MADKWTTSTISKGGEAYWLTRLGILTINSVRLIGLPYGTRTLQISVPTMWALAGDMYDGEYNEQTAIKPNEQPQFESSLGDV